MKTNEDLLYYWSGVGRGDKQSLFALYEALFSDMVNFAIKHSGDTDLSRDIVNEIFLEIWEQKDHLAPVKNVKPYLLTYVKRKVYRFYYRKSLIKKAEESIKFLPDLSYEQEIIAAQNDLEVKHRLRNALSNLTPTQVQLIQLRFFDGLTYDQISILRSISKKTAYNIIYDALKILKSKL